MRRTGQAPMPVEISGKVIASSYWGKAWCENIESYSDFSNRLPRGRTYVRNGSVLDLRVGAGTVQALVSGSQLYTVAIDITPLAAARWRDLVRRCSGQVASLMDLLQGRFSNGVMQILTGRDSGMFPSPQEMTFKCTCPDWASMCKHVAATLYGIGSRLDHEPELFFTLRQVSGTDLIAAAADGAGGLADTAPNPARTLVESDLSAMFGIDLDGVAPPSPISKSTSRRSTPTRPTELTKSAPKPPTPKTKEKKSTKKQTQRRRDVDELANVFGRGNEVTPAVLERHGIARSTYANWVTTGVLRRAGRGVYETTAATLERVRKAIARTGR